MPAPTGRPERILILVTADPSSAMVIRRAKRVADYLQADCLAVAIQKPTGGNKLAAGERDALERHLNFARNLHIDARLLDAETAGDDPAKALVEFARVNGVTQLFLARPRNSGLASVLRPGVEQRIVWLSRDMQVTIVAGCVLGPDSGCARSVVDTPGPGVVRVAGSLLVWARAGWPSSSAATAVTCTRRRAAMFFILFLALCRYHGNVAR